MSNHEKPCPFCGSTNLKSGGDDKIVGTWCLDCEAIGPNHYGRHKWNDRADRIEELEAKLAKAMQVVEMIASADVDAVLGEAVDISCEIIGELMEEEDDDL